MSSFSQRELDIRELAREFNETEFSSEIAGELMNGLSFGRVDINSVPISIEKLLMVYSNTDYVFTSDDLIWLEQAGRVVVGKKESGRKWYCVEMLCDEEDYYTCCAAIVKLFNAVFLDKGLFLFKIASSFALGTARDFESEIENNFCVSALINSANYSQYEEFLIELLYSEVLYSGDSVLPEIIIRYSPQENDHLQSKYDGVPHNVDPDYLSFLDEVEAFYGESAEKERQNYLSEIVNTRKATETYRNACRQLARTGIIDDKTSLDVLNAAEIAERKASNYVFSNSITTIEDDEYSLSKEAYNNAEIMLKELYARDTI